jgi:hypothetical protein
VQNGTGFRTKSQCFCWRKTQDAGHHRRKTDVSGAGGGSEVLPTIPGRARGFLPAWIFSQNHFLGDDTTVVLFGTIRGPGGRKAGADGWSNRTQTAQKNSGQRFLFFLRVLPGVSSRNTTLKPPPFWVSFVCTHATSGVRGRLPLTGPFWRMLSKPHPSLTSGDSYFTGPNSTSGNEPPSRRRYRFCGRGLVRTDPFCDVPTRRFYWEHWRLLTGFISCDQAATRRWSNHLPGRRRTASGLPTTTPNYPFPTANEEKGLQSEARFETKKHCVFRHFSPTVVDARIFWEQEAACSNHVAPTFL